MFYNISVQIIEPDSVFSIASDFSLSQMDEQVLSCLYLPIIKADAYTIYHHLLTLTQMDVAYTSHADLLSIVGISDADFLQGRMNLEAMGLLDTYRKKETPGQTRIFYHYHLYPPLDPRSFFSDMFYRPLFISIVGQKKYHEITSYFRVKEDISSEDYIQVSAGFKDIFMPSIDEGSLSLDAPSRLIGREHRKSPTIDFSEVEKCLKKSGYQYELRDEDIDSIMKDVNLYGIRPETAADLVMNCTNLDGVFFPQKFTESVRNVHTYSPTSEKRSSEVNISGNVRRYIDSLYSLTPQEYLFNLFKMKTLPDYMYEEIDKMSHDYLLSNEMITLILDYSLKKTNRSFNSLYIDKVASTLKANDINDPYSAMVFLRTYDFDKRGKGKKITKTPKSDEGEVSTDDLLDLKRDLGL